MARFRYLGEPPFAFVETMGPSLQFKIPKKDGTTMVLTAPDQDTGFVIGEDIGANITDQRSLRMMRADTRFQEI